MAKYLIHEGNFDKLKDKVAIIERKCARYGLKFHFEQTGEEFREKEIDGHKELVRFIEIEVEGVMKFQDWEFIAQIDHYEAGNIIRQFNTEIEVPVRFRHTAPVCEHCNTLRGRKFTYLVHNTSTDEWKQVGSSCLKEFTFGLDAEDVARYISCFDEIIKAGEVLYRGVNYTPYYDLKEFLCYANETINKLGYVSASTAQETGDISTREQTMDFYLADTKGIGLKFVEKKMKEINFDPMTDSNKEYVEAAISWIRSVTEEEINDNSYMFNLMVACTKDYFTARNAGFIVSLLPTYYRHLKHIEYEERKKREAETNPSRHQGTVGQRLSFKVKSIECISSNDSMYGTTFFYKILDENDNVYMWSTGKCLDPDIEYTQITGTVKSHDEYRGVQQTFLTRCKLVEGPRKEKVIEPATYAAENAVAEFLREMDN